MSWRDDPDVEAPAKAPGFAETPSGAVTGRARKPTWRDDEDVGPTVSQKVGAFGQGATGGMIEAAPVVAGAIMGAKLGAPILPPWGAVGGLVLGGLAGIPAGKTLREHAADIPLGDTKLTTRSTQDVSPELRPYAAAGETFGSGAVPGTLPYMAARQGVRVASPFVNRVIESAAERPLTHGLSETSGLAGASTAGGVAENYAPGNSGIRMGAEVTAGLFNPASLILTTTEKAANLTKQAVGSAARIGRTIITQTPGEATAAERNKASEILKNIVEQTGEDPAALAKALRENFPVPLTSAQKTGSNALAAIEQRLAKESEKFGAESRKLSEDGLSSLRHMIAALEGTGQPEALKAAAEVRKQYFNTLLTGMVQQAESKATEIAAKISKDSPGSQSTISRWANSAIDSALSDARKVETELWSKIPREVPASADNLLARHATIRDQLLPEEGLPGIIENFVARIGANDAKVTSGELLRFRSRALSLSREAASKGNSNEARIYGEMAESALDDLSAIADRTPGLNEARAFSRELNDTFTRTFAGDTQATKRTGADRIPPELVMRNALGEGKEAGALRFQQMRDAVGFLPEKGLGGPKSAEDAAKMIDAQERILRLSAAETINPVTGRISPVRLARFVEDNAELLNRFPEVRKHLQSAIGSETELRKIESIAKGADRIIESKAAFARVAKYESPADAIRSALSTASPAKDFGEIAKLARVHGGPDAVEGMKVATWEDAMRRSSTEAGGVSFARLQATLFNPIRPGQPSLAQMMRAHGLMTTEELSRADELIKRALTVERTLQRGGPNWEPLVGNTDGVFDLVARISGAKAGTTVANMMGPGVGGHELIAASAGSRYMRQLLEKIPQGRVKDVLIEAAKNPDFAATLLEKPKTAAEGFKLAQRAHVYLLHAGLLQEERE